MGARNHRHWAWCAIGAILLAMTQSGCFWKDSDTKNGESVPTSVPAASTGTVATSPAGTPTQPAPSADVHSAQQLYREGRYGDARAAFLSLANRTNDASEKAEAYLGLGNAAYLLNDTAAAFEAFQEAVAVAPDETHVAVRARYLLVQRLNDAGRFEEAAALFNQRPRIAGGSPLEPYYRFEGGRAQWGGSGGGIWGELVADPGVSSALKTLIRRSQVENLRDRGDAERLTTALDALIADSADPAARFERAELALAVDDFNTAGEQLRAIVSENPASRYASLALAVIVDRGFFVDPGLAGLAYYRRGAYQQAIEVLSPGVDAAASAGELAFRAYYLGASYEDLGLAEQAIRSYDIAAGSGADSQYIHGAKYWAARVSEWSDSPEAASSRYVALVTEGPKGEFTQEAAFRAGFVLLSAGDGAAALTVWNSLIGATSARLEYWKGRALLVSGDSQGAVTAYESASELGPLDLYGIEAARQLGRSAPIEVSYRERDLGKSIDWEFIQSWLLGRVGGVPGEAPPTAACELANAGLPGAAATEIWAAYVGSDTWRTFELMREASECGLANVAAQLAVALRIKAGVASHEPPKDLLRVAYPLDYVSTVDTESQKANVDPLFFASLIRQESFWDPSAGSSAGALGLTQVIPPTGEALANELGVAEFVPSMLFLPSLSLEFGAHYLGGQLEAYGNPWIALSAYNAGPGNAARWASSGAAEPADVVEVIDFSETKNYVTYIFEAYAHYRLAWGD